MNKTPLAHRMRPQKLSDVYGQEELLGEEAPLHLLIANNSFYSLLFWGPCGCGKTTVASLIGQNANMPVFNLSAVSAGVKEIREVIDISKERISKGQTSALLFIDEIHRLSKNQQDILLPALEDGSIKFIGATTENPSFEVNKAILSRILVFRFEQISSAHICKILLRAIAQYYPEREVEEKILTLIAESASGDARKALNLLESILAIASEKSVRIEDVKKLQKFLPLAYDKDGDEHYDLASAMIKSIRASHPDAALYYLARILEGGEKPEFIARRLCISASEDIGNANPHALILANASYDAVLKIGMPEARIILSQICTFLASSVKSNRSYVAINKAQKVVKQHGNLKVPLHLRNAPTTLMADFAYGKGYIYAHDDEENARKLTYLPEKLKGQKFYQPKNIGFEANIIKTLENQRPIAD